MTPMTPEELQRRVRARRRADLAGFGVLAVGFVLAFLPAAWLDARVDRVGLDWPGVLAAAGALAVIAVGIVVSQRMLWRRMGGMNSGCPACSRSLAGLNGVVIGKTGCCRHCNTRILEDAARRRNQCPPNSRTAH